MLWLKAFHLVFMVTWLSGLLSLPRMLVHHAAATDGAAREAFKSLERNMLFAMHVSALLTWLFGILMLINIPEWLTQDWKQIKLGFVVLLTFHHSWCAQIVRDFAADEIAHGLNWYRVFSLFPLVPLVAIVVMAVLKPF